MELFSCNPQGKTKAMTVFRWNLSKPHSRDRIERQHFRAENATLPSVRHDLRGEVVRREQFCLGKCGTLLNIFSFSDQNI